MPVKMVALRRHYVTEARKEYAPGESYVVHDKRAAEKLERRMKAKRAPEDVPDTKFPAAGGRLKARALTAETDAPRQAPAPAATPATQAPPSSVALPTPDVGTPALTTAAVTAAAPDAGETAESKARYARRDMRAEET